MAHNSNNQKNHHHPEVGGSQQPQVSRLMLLQEYLHKITRVSQEDYDTLYGQIFELIDESKHKSSEKHFKELFVEKFIDLYIQTLSDRVFKVLVGISAPLDEIHQHHNGVLERRCAAFILISNVVHRSPTWLPNIINSPLLNCFFDIMKNEQEIVILSISALILVELFTALPCLMSQYLDQIFSTFSRLCTFLYRGMNINDKKSLSDKKNLTLLNLNSIVYRVFIRLYAMYPCNFFTYLKAVYGVGCHKEPAAVFHKIIEPMLNKIRFHPLLITASKDKECDKSRWLYKEPHDILDECGHFSIDPIESSQSLSHSWDEDFSQWCELLSTDENETPSAEEKYFTAYQDEDCGAIFSQLQKEFNQKDKCTALKATPNDAINDENAVQGPETISDQFESAQEAIMLSCKSVETTAVQNRSDTKNLFKPVAISAAKNSMPSMLQKKGCSGVNPKKQLCFSPFKPIKEIANNHDDDNCKGISSPLIEQQNRTQSADQFNVSNNNENEDDDMEIIGYDLENKTKIEAGGQPLKRNDFGVSTTDKGEGDQGKVKCRFNDDSRIPDDLIHQAKQQCGNKRNRYRSNCLPETDKEDDYYYSNGFPISPSANLRAHSESCPMLYFKSDDDDDDLTTSIEIAEKNKNNSDNCFGGNKTVVGNNDKQKDGQRITDKPTAKVNLILEDPNLESRRRDDLRPAYKTCKSVDFTKETKARRFSYHSRTAYLNKLFSSLTDSQRSLFRGSSMDFSTAQYKLEVGISSPHELLDRMLSTFSDVYLKEYHQQDSGQVGRRDSGASTSSNSESLNFIGCHSSNEEEMRKILAIMYAQLVFERHQRDLHVIRNRRLYKKSKECIQLEERYEALRKQMVDQMTEIQSLNASFEKMLIDFQQERHDLHSQISRLQEESRLYKTNFETLQTEKFNLEQQFRQEIAELNKNFRNKELELNKYLCNNNKNIDLVEKENLELKNQIFLFGEFCGKVRDAYCYSKLMAPDLNEKLILDSLRYENKDLNKKNIDLGTQLRLYIDKCQVLENQLKKEELKRKDMVDSSEMEYARECLKAKDTQIEVLKTLVVNYESHIKKLTGELACKPASLHPCKT